MEIGCCAIFIFMCDKHVEAIKHAVRKNDSVSIYLFRKDNLLKTDVTPV